MHPSTELRDLTIQMAQAISMTVVYRHEDGLWKMVHFHSSIGVPNEDAIGIELPT